VKYSHSPVHIKYAARLTASATAAAGVCRQHYTVTLGLLAAVTEWQGGRAMWMLLLLTISPSHHAWRQTRTCSCDGRLSVRRRRRRFNARTRSWPAHINNSTTVVRLCSRQSAAATPVDVSVSAVRSAVQCPSACRRRRRPRRHCAT